MRHHEELIATGPVGDSELHVHAAADNRVCVFIAGSHPNEGPRAAGRRILFKDQVCVEPMYALDIDGWSLSFDGTKLATSHEVIGENGRRYHDIRINGVSAYRSDYDTVYSLHWLDNERLAWVQWMDDESRAEMRHEVFVNGENVTGRIDYMVTATGNGATGVLLRENGMRYVLDEDGVRTQLGPSESPSVLDDFRGLRHTSGVKEERAEEIWDRGRRRVRVLYRDYAGPEFDGLEGQWGMPYTADRSAVGYIGIRYGRVVRFASDWLTKHPKLVGLDAQGGFGIRARIFAVLFNPYFGPGHLWAESSKRFFPIVNDRPWKKGYAFVRDRFFTPQNAFVVLAQAGGYHHVVIDEQEGPAFDEVIHLRWLEAEQCVCYIGRRGNQYFRVIVGD